MHTVQLLTNFVLHHEILAYGVIFLGAILEGEVVVITSGILAHLGAINLWCGLTFILLGGFGKTFFFYYIGTLVRRKWHSTKFLNYIEKRVHNFMPRFQEKPFWSIFLSKFIMGANNLVIIFSGFKQINYRKFLQAEVIGTLIWAPGLLFLGYFFSYTAFHVSHEIGKFTLIVLTFVIIFVIFDKTLSWLYELFEEFRNNGNK